MKRAAALCELTHGKRCPGALNYVPKSAQPDCVWIEDRTYADGEPAGGWPWHVVVIGGLAVTTAARFSEVEEAYRDGLIR